LTNKDIAQKKDMNQNHSLNMVMPIGVALQDMFLSKTLILAFSFPFKKVLHAFSFLMNKVRLTMSTSLKLELLVSTARWGFPFIFEWLYDDLDEKNPKIYVL
jgi:hypothetical protein